MTSHCSKECIQNINCCQTSSPCFNGGTCVPFFLNRRKRFICKCRDKFEGQRCEKKRCQPGYTGEHCDMPIKSCIGYKNSGGDPGYYIVLDESNTPYQVYCDLHHTTAWTLIQSFSLKNKDQFAKPFSTDHPVNEEHVSWIMYRLSDSRIRSILSQSNTRWRITCNYDKYGFRRRDFVQGNIADRGPFYRRYNSSCVKVHSIDIRGYGCGHPDHDCKAFMVNDGIHPFYIDPQLSKNCGLNVQNITTCNGVAENSFGYYKCVNRAHHCSSSGNSTTQIWFGGHT